MDPSLYNSDSCFTRSSDGPPPSDPGRPELPTATSEGGQAGGAKYKLMSPAKLPISRSPCITIPPGLSPTSFLESPVMLSNMAEPSPTTGSLIKPQMHRPSDTTSFPIAARVFSYNNTSDDGRSDFFEFKPHARANMVFADTNPGESDELKRVQGHQGQSQSFATSSSAISEMAVFPDDLSLSSPKQMATSGASASVKVDSVEFNPRGPMNVIGSGISVMAEKSSDDGYNWRKYGQKLVKGSEFPRSYYKCTHPNCEVKKLFERSHDGQITEIIYKGTHDHPKPQLNRRYSGGAMISIQEEKADKPLYLNCQDDKSAARYGQISEAMESNCTHDRAPVTLKDDNVEGTGSLLNKSNDDVDDDDPFSKRRKMDVGGFDVAPLVKPIREPRVVVQTLSEVDILDDGYRWRKYGQKVVRGNPNPRSYYKCTNAGCPVRKHVERACHDPKAVITTYEGKHNHDVPTAKSSSSHDTPGLMTMGGPSRFRLDENEDVSLDLGVGINAATENRSNCYSQTQNNRSNFKAVEGMPAPTYFGVVNRGGINQFGSRENMSDGRSIDVAPVNHSSYQYSQNMGRILTGP